MSGEERWCGSILFNCRRTTREELQVLEAAAEKKELQFGDPELKKTREIYGDKGAEKSATLAAEE